MDNDSPAGPSKSKRHRVVRKQPPRNNTPATEARHNIYITSKTDFKAQLKRCQELLNTSAKEIYLHCMGFAVGRGLNLALRLVQEADGALGYAINTSTIRLLDELHPLSNSEDLSFRKRNNSALHIRIFNRSLFNVVVPSLPAAKTPTPATRSGPGQGSHFRRGRGGRGAGRGAWRGRE